jgi:hypothetical protein
MMSRYVSAKPQQDAEAFRQADVLVAAIAGEEADRGGG